MAQVSTLYVDDDTCQALGSGAPVDPFCAIQSAVNAASSQDEIRVAQGRYTGAEMVTFAPHDWTDLYTYTQVVFISKPITLSSGFSPTDWDTPDPTANPTLIDAEGYGRGVSIVSSGADRVTLNGFTITGGDYTGLGNPPETVNQVCRGSGRMDCGGGVYAYSSALILLNSVITNNVAGTNYRAEGGGIYSGRCPLAPASRTRPSPAIRSLLSSAAATASAPMESTAPCPS